MEVILMDKKKNSRSRKYMLTINNPAEHEESHSNIKKKLCKYQVDYIAMCDETGSQGTYHTHVYVKYHNAIQFSKCKYSHCSGYIYSEPKLSPEIRTGASQKRGWHL